MRSSQQRRWGEYNYHKNLQLYPICATMFLDGTNGGES